MVSKSPVIMPMVRKIPVEPLKKLNIIIVHAVDLMVGMHS